MQKSKLANQSFFNSNERFIEEYIAKLQDSEDKGTYETSISSFDQQLYSYYAAQNYLTNPISKQLYEMPAKNSVKLDVPKNNSLTDSMLRTTLGCEEKLAQSYLQILDQTEKIEGDEKQKRIEEAKKKFAASNCHRDILANSKAFITNSKYFVDRPVVDNEHEAYMKTQLTFMQNPNSARSPKDFIDKYSGTIAKKITEMGGIQDTIEQMEVSLSANEITNAKKRQTLGKSQQRKASKSPLRTTTSGYFKTNENGWLNKSRQMRQQMTASALR